MKILTRYLAANLIYIDFERIYHNIFGSQLNLLQFLNSRPKGENLEGLKPFYDLAVTMHPKTADYPFQQYLDYLINTGLIIKKEGLFYITQMGREFLEYLIKQGYSLSLPF